MLKLDKTQFTDSNKYLSQGINKGLKLTEHKKIAHKLLENVLRNVALFKTFTSYLHHKL